MRIVVALQSLAGIGGTETYATTVAEQLQRLGHDVVLATPERGKGADLATSRGVCVVGLDELPEDEGAVVLTQDAAVAYTLSASRPAWPQVHVAHSDIFDSQLPAAVPQLQAVVVLYDRVERRIRAMDLSCPVVRLEQPIDVERFKPLGPLRAAQPVVLALGNYLSGGRAALVEQACSIAGCTLLRVGAHGTETELRPEELINQADVVIGKARVIYEALACGRLAYVFDHNGGEGWVTRDNVAALAADNFGGQDRPVLIDAERLAADLAAYDPAAAHGLRDHVVAHHAASKHAAALIELMSGLDPAPVSAERSEALELARLTRLFHLADVERFWLRASIENERAQALGAEDARRQAAEELERVRTHAGELEHRITELDAQLADANARVEELDALRKDAEAVARAALARERPSRRQRLINRMRGSA